MIGYIEGIVFEKGAETVVVNCNGIGYELSLSTTDISKLPPVGHKVCLYAHLIWKDDFITLYGFLSREDRDMFRMLIQVSGIGPRLAISCLSALNGRELLKAISCADTDRLKSISGIGKKTAERICLELKDRASGILDSCGEREGHIRPSAILNTKEETQWNEAYMALINLGYKEAYIKGLLRGLRERLKSDALTTEAIIKAALQEIYNKNR